MERWVTLGSIESPLLLISPSLLHLAVAQIQPSIAVKPSFVTVTDEDDNDLGNIIVVDAQRRSGLILLQERKVVPQKFQHLLLGFSLLWLVAACTPLNEFLSLAQEFTPKASTPQSSPIDRISVSGGYAGSLEQVGGKLSTTIGYHYTSRTEKRPVTVGHFLVLWPEINYKNYNVRSTSFGTEHLGPFVTEYIKITLREPKVDTPDCIRTDSDLEQTETASESSCEQRIAFEARFHVDEHTFTIGNQTFARADGNLFIVRFDENFNMQATQVPKVYEEIAKTTDILEAYKAALPEDEFIQNLKIEIPVINGKPDEPGPPPQYTQYLNREN